MANKEELINDIWELIEDEESTYTKEELKDIDKMEYDELLKLYDEILDSIEDAEDFGEDYEEEKDYYCVECGNQLILGFSNLEVHGESLYAECPSCRFLTFIKMTNECMDDDIDFEYDSEDEDETLRHYLDMNDDDNVIRILFGYDPV